MVTTENSVMILVQLVMMRKSKQTKSNQLAMREEDQGMLVVALVGAADQLTTLMSVRY